MQLLSTAVCPSDLRPARDVPTLAADASLHLIDRTKPCIAASAATPGPGPARASAVTRCTGAEEPCTGASEKQPGTDASAAIISSVVSRASPNFSHRRAAGSTDTLSGRYEHHTDTLAAAILAVKHGKSQREASSDFHVPRTTLQHYIDRRVGDDAASFAAMKEAVEAAPHAGRPASLSAVEESRLVSWIEEHTRAGHSLTRREINQSIAALRSMKGERARGCGSKFFDRLLTTHPNLTVKKPSLITPARASAADSELIALFYSRIHEWVELHHPQPNQIWAADETGFGRVETTEKVFGHKGERAHRLAPQQIEHFSVLAVAAASGQSLPPFFVFHGGSSAAANLLEGASAGSLCATNDKVSRC